METSCLPRLPTASRSGPRDNFGNYRAIGLMCHSYKLLSMLVLHRMRDAVESRLAETQAGFRRERGCRENVLLLRLLMDAVLRAGKQAVVTFIDYRAAFDTISHRFLDESLTAAGVQPKIRRIVKAIYAEATGMVRLRLPSGETLCSEPFPVRRGVIQGDIFSLQGFTLGLDRIFRLHDIAGQSIGGPFLGDVTASKLEYADCSTGRQLRPRSVSLRWREAREHPPRWRCRRPRRKACMCTPESDYQCRRKWRLRHLTSHTAAPNARGHF